MASSPLVVESTDSIKVNDGTSIENQCADADQLQWTYNYGTMISGAAYMYNYVRCRSYSAYHIPERTHFHSRSASLFLPTTIMTN